MNTLDLLTLFLIAFVLRAFPIPSLQPWNLRRSRMALMKEMEMNSEYSYFNKSSIMTNIPVEKVKCLYISARQWRRMP